MQPVQPKITQKLLLRSAIAIFILAGLVLAYQWYKRRESDPLGGQTLDTADWIAAIETTGDGRHVVAIKPDASVVQQNGVPKESQDRDVAWRPDGNFVAFASNRDKGKFTMFRWRPDGGSPEMRSLFGATQGSPYFLRADADLHDLATGLVTGAGKVFMWEPKVPALRQVLPPPDPNSRTGASGEQDEGEGRVSQFEAFYDRLGKAFRLAKWTPDRRGVYAVMTRESGEILIFQRLDATKPEEAIPRTIVAGDKIDFDIDQNTGNLYFSVQNFQYPTPESATEHLKNGKLETPYHHAVGLIQASHPGAITTLAKSFDDKTAFGSVTVSPDGQKVAYVEGAYAGDGNLDAKSLWVFVVAGPNAGKRGQFVAGQVFEPSWSPDSNTLVYARRDGEGKRLIYTSSLDDPSPRLRSPDAGVFSNPVFSPQIKG
jgi:hypothetical protein